MKKNKTNRQKSIDNTDLHLRLDHDNWQLLRRVKYDTNISLNKLVNMCISKYAEDCKKVLTGSGTMV